MTELLLAPRSNKQQLATGLQQPRRSHRSGSNNNSLSSHAPQEDRSAEAASSSVQMYRTSSAGVPSLPESPLAAAATGLSPSPLALATQRVIGGRGSGPTTQPHPLSNNHTRAPPLPVIKVSNSDASSTESEDEHEWSPMDDILGSSTVNMHPESTNELPTFADSPLLGSRSAVWASSSTAALDLKGSRSTVEIHQQVVAEKKAEKRTAVQVRFKTQQKHGIASMTFIAINKKWKKLIEHLD